MSLPYPSDEEADPAAISIVNTSLNPANSTFKPKPILVDKQSSEPSSPITRSFREQPVIVTRRPMHRGYSDLGNRIKKKVTLR